MSKFKQYVGDSVYADFDGFHIILTTENGLPNDPSNRIALEPWVLHALSEYYYAWLKQFSSDGAQPEGGGNPSEGSDNIPI